MKNRMQGNLYKFSDNYALSRRGNFHGFGGVFVFVLSTSHCTMPCHPEKDMFS